MVESHARQIRTLSVVCRIHHENILLMLMNCIPFLPTDLPRDSPALPNRPPIP